MAVIRAQVHKESIKIVFESIPYSLQEKARSEFPVNDWIEGERLPTLKQIQRLANLFKVPQGIFWLTPENAKKYFIFKKGRRQIPYYRAEGLSEPPPAVQEEIYFLSDLQEWISEILKEEEKKPIELIGILSENEDPEEAAEKIRKQISLDENWLENASSRAYALKRLLSAVEEHGIAVTISGVAGTNNKMSIPVDECRGFTLIDPYIPWIFINGNDAPSGQLFTLAHELVHIALGKSAADQLSFLDVPNIQTERFCNAVAGAFLLPASVMSRDKVQVKSEEELNDYLFKLHKRYKVSKAAIARRLLDLRMLNYELYKKWYEYWWKQFENSKFNRQTQGGNFYSTTRRRLSNLFIKYTKRALLSGIISYKELYKKLPFKPSTILNLLETS